MRDMKQQGSIGGFVDWSAHFEVNASGFRWLRSNGSIITVASNTKYQYFKVTYHVLIPKYSMGFVFCHAHMRDSDFGGDVHSTVLNAAVLILVCTESGVSFSFAFAMSPKLAIRQERCESRCHAALILEAAPLILLPGFITDTKFITPNGKTYTTSREYRQGPYNTLSPAL